MIRADYIERFIAQIEVQPDGCWIWQGRVNTTSPYGHCYVGHRDERWAHRVAYRHIFGDIPPDLELDHLCNVPLCVNVFHLEAVTPQENKRRAALRRPENEHATLARYWGGCRCEPCYAVGLTYQRDHVARIRAEAAAGSRPIPHGTDYGYNQFACRCEECRAAKRLQARQRPDRTGMSREQWDAYNAARHGTTSMYTAHKCRCDECRANWSEYWKAYRLCKKAAAA